MKAFQLKRFGGGEETSTPHCSKCGREIPADDINPAKDLAYCRNCNLAQSLSAMVHGEPPEALVDINRPPAGAWFRNDGMGPVVGATHRSLLSAGGLLFFCLFWNGIVSVFVLVAIAGTLEQMGINQPSWFPAPKMDGNPMGLGMVLFLWIFLLPFIAIGVGMLGAFLSAIAGRTEVRLRPGEGVMVTGIGLLSYRRRFDPQSVREVRIENTPWQNNNGRSGSKSYIVLKTQEGKTIRFGSLLSEERRSFVAASLRSALKM